MKKYFFLLAILFISMINISAKSKFDIKKVIIGGSFGFGATNGQTSINIAPQLGYQFNKFFAAGAGVGYNYYSYKDVFSQKYTQNYLGFNVYGQATPIRYIAIKVQPEISQVWGQNMRTQTVPCVLVGAGATLPAGNNGGVSMMFYYDVVQNAYSPYGKEIFYSIGYTFGF